MTKNEPSEVRIHTKDRAKRATGGLGGWPPRKKKPRCDDGINLHLNNIQGVSLLFPRKLVEEATKCRCDSLSIIQMQSL
jgi:hypothetical protein